MTTTMTPPKSGSDMFEAYRAHRRRGKPAAEAIDLTLHQFNRRGTAERERFARTLVEDEAALALHDEAASEPEVPADPNADLAAIERDADARVALLRKQRQRLAPEALTDDAVKAELLNIESELVEAERAAELAPLAREERERREREAREQAKEQQREAAFNRGRELEPERVKRAQGVDKAIAALMKALKAYRDTAGEQYANLRRAGLDPQRHHPERVLAAVRAGMLAEQLPSVAFADVFGPLGKNDRPLAESEPEKEL